MVCPSFSDSRIFFRKKQYLCTTIHPPPLAPKKFSMKILHTADWHLGNVFHGHDRREEHCHFLNWLADVLEERQPDALLISGDVFDSPNPSAAAEQMFYDFLQRATELVEGLQIVIIAGNHDSAGRLEAPASLLSTHYIYIKGLVHLNEQGEPNYGNFLIPLRRRGETEASMLCFALPYLRAADWPGGSPADGLRHYFKQLHHLAAKGPYAKLPRIALAHFYASGAEISAEGHSERLVVGGQDCVEASVMGEGFSYVALGHIHKQQKVAEGIYYAGSALPMSFSERGYRHGVQWVEIEPGGVPHTFHIGYSPLRELLTIPSHGAASVAEVQSLLEELPVSKKKDNGANWPYLEIRVEESQPEPGLLQRVNEILENRAVRFCRMVRQTHLQGAESETPIVSLESLRELQPLDMARSLFENKYHTGMPEVLVQRFLEAESEARQEP